ncbi:MAG: fructose-bisphosphatase class II family protein [Ancalomicrobiaceae bacterium]|nr:fructose-bisphosphatase class II family protein [Ancalomicrobiaceae bacterium]
MAVKPQITAQNELPADSPLAAELVRITELTAIAAARLRGHGDEQAADRVATETMHAELQKLAIDGTVVVGQGPHDQSECLYVGEKIGSKRGPKVDLVLAPLEGATICAKNQANSISAAAVAPRGSFLAVPKIYMEKIAIGPGYPEGLLRLDATPAENLNALADAKGVPISALTVCILDRPRHARLIEEVRAAGAAIRLIADGDVVGVIHTTMPEETGVDIYMGCGGAAEGVLAAAALACSGGQMLARLVADRPGQVELLRKAGIGDPRRIYGIADMVCGDVIFAATAVTDGRLMKGVRFSKSGVTTHSSAMRSATGMAQSIETSYRTVGVATPW